MQLHNDRAEVKNDCPSDDAWWHFVLAPNNGQYEFSSMNLNIGGSATLISSTDIDNEPTIKTVDEAPAIEEATETAAPSIEEAAEVAANTKKAPSAEVAPEAAVAADDTDHNALPATGMELPLAFLGLGLAGLGGTLLAARRRTMII